jgi:hypothetical protein
MFFLGLDLVVCIDALILVAYRFWGFDTCEYRDPILVLVLEVFMRELMSMSLVIH